MLIGQLQLTDWNSEKIETYLGSVQSTMLLFQFKRHIFRLVTLFLTGIEMN